MLEIKIVNSYIPTNVKIILINYLLFVERKRNGN